MKGNKKQEDILNDKIRSKELLVISEDGEQLGNMNRDDALKRAYDVDLDLVVISPGAKPPVAKIMDYGKFKYEKQKKDRENKQKQKQKIVTLKVIRVSPTIDSNDYNTKIKHAKKFLEKGDKVQFLIRFKGRMITHSELGRDVLMKIAEDLKDYSTIEQKPTMDGRKMLLTLASNIKK